MSMPGCISRPSPYGDVRAPKGEVTSPRTGQSVGTPRLTSSPRSFTSTVSTANESLAAAACPSSQASCSSARPASSDTTDMPPSSIAATLTSGRVSARPSSMCARRRASAPRSPSAAVVRARRSTPRATWAISRRWRATSSRLSASRVRNPATSSRSAALRCSACHTCLAAAAPMTTTSAAARREPCPAREMTGAAGIDLVEDERGAPLVGGGEGLEREHDARQLAARGHAGERARLLARVGREEELDLVPALGAERAPLGLGETRLEARAGERQRLELRDESARQIARLPPPLDREPARPLGGGAPGRLGRGLELYHRLATARDAVDLGHQLVAPADQVLDRAGELAFQARELRQALLHRLQATRVGGQLAGIAAEALAGLLQLGERALEEGAHGLEARVEPGRLAQRDERAAEHLDHRALAGVEALLPARRQHGQALGVHQAGPLRPKRPLLARHERAPRHLPALPA